QVKYVLSDGVRFEYETATRQKKPSSSGPKQDATGPGEVDEKTRTSETEADRRPHLGIKGNVLLRGATLVTVTDGIKTDRDLLVLDGKIARIGKNLVNPADRGPVPELDAHGMFVMPGIIDTHSHFAISGGVNE